MSKQFKVSVSSADVFVQPIVFPDMDKARHAMFVASEFLQIFSKKDPDKSFPRDCRVDLEIVEKTEVPT